VKIAIIAWGPMVLRPEILSIIGRFKLTDLRLPIEFCRVDDYGRLTLAIDGVHGALCPARVATSGFDDLPHAVNNLRKRESTTRENIGVVGLGAAHFAVRSLNGGGFDAVEPIRAWIAANGYDAAIWPALPGNFPDIDPAGAFSVEAAIRRLEAMQPDARDYALGHIRDAPSEVQTPVRAAVEAHWPLTHSVG